MHLLEETGEDSWKSTPFTLNPGDLAAYGESMIPFSLDQLAPLMVNLPQFLAADPAVSAAFMGLMMATRNYTSGLVASADLDISRPLFVDVGGARGLDASSLLGCHPDLPSETRVLVEDLPSVISDLPPRETLDPRVQRIAHDFCTPQPDEGKGARAYFLHAVLHDWSDADSLRIFAGIHAAMKPGYSKLLICEVVLPPQGATSRMTTMDLMMMSACSGLERTEVDWRKLLGNAGFDVVKIWNRTGSFESVIEAALAGYA
ncbi:S-adenosyl-L-methionine-dependent methyltransferase [Mycena kentingensis (nom. inval.)]|nr:S-adenosyl-L-methionine-dependent methyltransferase [Mycena kentingensis (nom. inval.)]